MKGFNGLSRNSWHLRGHNHECSNVLHLYKNFREGKLKVSAINVNHAPFSTYHQGNNRPPVLPHDNEQGSHAASTRPSLCLPTNDKQTPPPASERQQKPPDALQATSHRT